MCVSVCFVSCEISVLYSYAHFNDSCKCDKFLDLQMCGKQFKLPEFSSIFRSFCWRFNYGWLNSTISFWGNHFFSEWKCSEMFQIKRLISQSKIFRAVSVGPILMKKFPLEKKRNTFICLLNLGVSPWISMCHTYICVYLFYY